MSQGDEEYTRQMMRAVAQGLDEILNPKRPKKYAFILLIAEFNKIEDGKVNYVSNGRREDMIAMMKEYIARAEGNAMPETKTIQ